MRRVAVLLMLAAGAAAQPAPVARVHDDAVAIDRIAEASRRGELPTDVLRRMVNEDIELLRGRRADGTYQYATFERLEASRTTSSLSVQPRGDRMETLEMRGEYVYRVVLEVPNRRLFVRPNRQVWVERVDVDYVREGSTRGERDSIEVKTWLQPGQLRTVDLAVIARQAAVKVVATADPQSGYGNIDVTLVQARIVDLADSPYADAVASAKAILRALDHNDVPSIRAMAQRMRRSVAPAAATVDVVASDAANTLELQAELQVIEGLLGGGERERREGMDRLRQVIDRMRR